MFSTHIGATAETNHKFPITLAFLMEFIDHIKLTVPDLKHLHLVVRTLWCSSTGTGTHVACSWGLQSNMGSVSPGTGWRLDTEWDPVKHCGSIQTATEFVEIQTATDKVTLIQITGQEIKEFVKVVKSWCPRGSSKWNCGIWGSCCWIPWPSRAHQNSRGCYDDPLSKSW